MFAPWCELVLTWIKFVVAAKCIGNGQSSGDAPHMRPVILTVCRKESALRDHSLRSVISTRHGMVRAGCFEAVANDWRVLVRIYSGRVAQAGAIILV